MTTTTVATTVTMGSSAVRARQRSRLISSQGSPSPVKAHQAWSRRKCQYFPMEFQYFIQKCQCFHRNFIFFCLATVMILTQPMGRAGHAGAPAAHTYLRHTHTLMHTGIHTCMHACMLTHVYTCMHTRHTHTHLHTILGLDDDDSHTIRQIPVE